LLISIEDCATATLVLRGAKPRQTTPHTPIVCRGILRPVYTMQFCSAETCPLYLLSEGSADCLRKQAHHCITLSKRVFRRGVRDALVELSLNLMDEARAIENKQTIPAAFE